MNTNTIRFARLTRKSVIALFAGPPIYVNPFYIIAMADKAVGGGAIVKIAIVDTGAANIPAPGVDLFGSQLANAPQPTRMPLVTVEVNETVAQILAQIA
jgi:hypothetical protein